MSIEPAGGRDIDRPRSRALEVSFQLHAVTYVAVNLMLVVIWALTGGYFWPVWPIVTWAPPLLIHGWLTYGRIHGD